jgi:hypothetical protein
MARRGIVRCAYEQGREYARKGDSPVQTVSSSGSSWVQVTNPVTERWVKLDTRTGRIVDTKKSPGPYEGVPKT